MSRLVIVLPLIPLGVGDSFAVRDWPLHITVLPPFLSSAEPAAIADAVATACAEHGALRVVADHDELFGRRHDIPVTLVREHPALTELHRTLIDAVRPFATTPEEPAFTGDGFRPHVTIKGLARVNAGEELTLSQIAIVDMLPRAHAAGRTVLATYALQQRP
ncbi:2'-5' RNA ligase superfamily protein [Microterricola gilva]|uniref:2'-5' RNA ligase superfamily protein n=1 Tax=Microterricola gilva TaxID=393267 RepID=A0A4Q8AQQ6_9MICO|nr:2'-5' RNA ligase family protein [Microterricola gilva]RZU67034.1 2'-5' RNA ligase superfamily protein [Microterricola gilva]